MNKNFNYKICLLIALYIILIYLDYRYHTYLERTLLGNFVWLGYFRFGPAADLRYSCDVIICTILFLAILSISIIKKNIKNYLLILFPVICFMIHEFTIL
ncbi:MAG: hypothetical protein ABRQ27_10280 [Clostridiaceae bacterium]